MIFFIEVVLSGLMAGVMYSLVALGFVLIFKASGVFNFAQGVMALFAALTLVGFMEKFGMPVWLAIAGTIVVMIALAWVIERLMLRHLVNQEPIILFMATIGLAYVLEGLGDILWVLTSSCWISAYHRGPRTGCWTASIFTSKNWKFLPR